MLPNLFAHPILLINGLIVGIILGFLLQKGNLTHFKTIVGQFLLQDFTMSKVMITAIFVGAIGIQLFLSLSLPISLQIRAGTILATVIGGAIMGIGIAILGYCPGTCVAAAGQGTRDALWGLFGMLLGAALYSETHILLKNNILIISKISNARLTDLFSISPWFIIGILGIIVIVTRLFSAKNQA